MNLSIEDKAIAMNLAMNIDQGNVNLEELIKVMNQYWSDWQDILNFWESVKPQSEMLKSVLDRIYLEYIYLNS
jgi:hypothetical protein